MGAARVNAEQRSWGGTLFALGVLGLVIAWAVFDGGFVAWLYASLCAMVVVPVTAFILWFRFFVRDSLPDVWRRSKRPMFLRWRNKTGAAAHSCEKILRQATAFQADDCRRGLMLSELAHFLAGSGRRQEARPLMNEGLAILEKLRDAEPVAYLIGLNHAAQFWLRGRDFAQAQVCLETALDWTAVAAKAVGEKRCALGGELPFMDLVLCSNLALLLVELDALDDAKDYLSRTEEGIPRLPWRERSAASDAVNGLRAFWLFKTGDLSQAEAVCDKIRDQNNLVGLRVRAKIHLAKGRLKEAQAVLLRLVGARLQQLAGVAAEDLDAYLDLAEAEFNLGEYAAALTIIREAAALASVASDPCWRAAAPRWRTRAGHYGESELALFLEKGRADEPRDAHRAITVATKFRIYRSAGK